jgi:hypothetical protein
MPGLNGGTGGDALKRLSQLLGIPELLGAVGVDKFSIDVAEKPVAKERAQVP